jgi:CheY-like chemotaxis protein
VSARDVLILGNFRGASRSALTTATNSLKLNVVEFTSVDEAIAALASEAWQAMLVDTTLSGASRFCAEARAVRGLFDVPLIALSPRLTDLAFLNALRWGADDVVALGAAEPLSVRLAPLLARVASPDRKPRGLAVVADPDRRRADGLGRALHLAGYNVKYANDPVSARYYLAKSDTTLYVLNSELADPTELIATAEQGTECKSVVLAKPTQLPELEQQFRGNRNVAVMSSGGPPENLLFAVNLLFPNEASKRGETRALFGTVVFFRAVGDYRDECGFSYTASPQGIYVRTLAPAPSDKVWVELIPPDGDRRVRLVGRVAWSHPFGSNAAEAAPPGFGVRIVDGLGEDLTLWSTCLRSLEFRAPATLVPEARFSTPMSRLSSPDDLRPFLTQGDRLTTPPQNHASVEADNPLTTDVARAAQDQSTNESPAAAPPISKTSAATSQKKPEVSVNLTLPPTSLPLSRLRNTSNPVSTRPSLRLSVSGPASGRRDSLLRSGKLGRAPGEELTPLEPTAVPSRPGQGQTVLGLGLLKRDGSASDTQTRPAVLPPKPTEPADVASSLEPYIVSPVAGAKTANYTPAPPYDRPTFPPSSWDDDTARTSIVDDISDRPTLTDRLTTPQSGAPMSANELEPFGQPSADRPSSAPQSPQTLDSLPPDALESDAPNAGPEYSHGAPLLRRDPIARTYIGQPPPPSLNAEADKHWAGLDRGSEALFSAAERELEIVHRASIPAGGTLPGIAGPIAPTVAVLGSHHGSNSAEVAPDTDPDATLNARGNEVVSSDGLTPVDESPFEAARLSPIPPTKALAGNGGPPTLSPIAARPKRRGWLLIAVALCAALVLLVLVRQTQQRTARKLQAVAVSQPDQASSLSVRADPTLVQSTPPREVVPLDIQSTAPDTSAPSAVAATTANVATTLPTGILTPEPDVSVWKAVPTPLEETAQNANSATPVAAPNKSHEITEASAPTQQVSAPPKDPQELAAKSAWLFVRSDVDARVFVHGVDSGATNTWLETPCGTRFIRLGRSAGDWVGQGFASVIRCRNSNIVDGVAE